MKKIFIAFLLLVSLLPAAAGNKHYTVIVSLDGFRWDYTKMYSTPFFDEMAREGVQAVMFPSFPSKTFPNHYTLATGLYPDHHGIVANSFWAEDKEKMYSMSDSATRNDPSFYGDILATEAEVLAALTASANANLIGKRVCDLAIAAGLLDKESCIMIGDIPHAQIYGL